MAKYYQIKTFRGGISDESDKGVPGAFKHGYSLDIHGRDDILACSSSMTTVDSSTIGDLVQFLVPASDGSLYAFGSTGSIYAVAGNRDDPAVSFAYNDEAGNILGATEFQGNDGISYMYWATSTQLSQRAMNSGEKAVPWTNVTANYKTDKISSSAVWHPMKVAMGQLNIGNGSDLASLSYALEFDPADLNIIPGNLINCLEERDDYILLGSEREDDSEEGHIFSWITTATNWVQKKKIPVKGINAMITTELPLMQGGSNGELFFSDFVNQIPLHGIPGGGRVNPGAVSIHDDLALFGFYGGTYPGLWTYGRKRKNRPFALNYQYRLVATVAGSSVSTIGAVSVLNGIPYVSWGTTDGSTSDYGIDCVSTTTKANAVYEGLEFDAKTPSFKKFFETVKFTMSPLVSGTSVSAKFKIDKETDWRYAVTATGGTTFSTADATDAEFTIGKTGKVIEIGCELNASGASGPEILSITTSMSDAQYDHA